MNQASSRRVPPRFWSLLSRGQYATKADLEALSPGGGGDVATDVIWSAKGDLAVGTGDNAAVVVPVGSNGTVLAADSSEPAGVKWTAISGTGDVVGPASSTNNEIVLFDGTSGKAIKGSGTVPTVAGLALLDDANAAAQRATLGLGTAATENTSAFAAASHTHTLSQITDAGTAAAQNTSAFEPAGAVSAHASATSGVHGISSFGATLIDDATAAAARSTLELGTAATQNTSAFEASGAVSAHSAATSGVHGISSFGATLIDDANQAAARTTLGLGTAAVENTSAFAAASHTHNASDINAGTINTARLGSGTASASTFLRGDQTWASPPGGGSTVVTGQIVGSSGTITATAGRTLIIIGSGAYGNSNAAQTATLNYNGSEVVSHQVRQGATTDRIGINLVARVTAVSSATASITVSGGSLYNPIITWFEIG